MLHQHSELHFKFVRFLKIVYNYNWQHSFALMQLFFRWKTQRGVKTVPPQLPALIWKTYWKGWTLCLTAWINWHVCIRLLIPIHTLYIIKMSVSINYASKMTSMIDLQICKAHDVTVFLDVKCDSQNWIFVHQPLLNLEMSVVQSYTILHECLSDRTLLMVR